MANKLIDTNKLTAIADAIRAKTGSTDTYSVDAMPDAISSISGGGGEPTPVYVPKKDINFYDYDGTRVAAWTLAELAAAADLPANPTHDGLTAQGWNWTLADLKTENAQMDVGQMYITDDGKTRLYITISDVGRMDVPLCFNQSSQNGVTIDWGDGSDAETLPYGGNKNTTHTYTSPGDYVITLEVTAGTLVLGISTNSHCVLGSTASSNTVYRNMLRKVEIGSGVPRHGLSAFNSCYMLSKITTPNGLTSLYDSVFRDCRSLSYIALPDGITYTGSNVFNSCYTLSVVSLPSNVTLGSNMFNGCNTLSQLNIPKSVNVITTSALAYCYGLSKIVISRNVTQIETSAFAFCYCVKDYYIYPTTPPTLDNSNAFNGIASDAVIHVPAGSVEDYKTAPNWSVATIADKIVGDL